RSRRAAGSSNAHLPGLMATAASPKTSRGQSPAPRLGSISPRFSFSLGEWRVPNSIYTILSRTLSDLGVTGDVQAVREEMDRGDYRTTSAASDTIIWIR